MFRYVNASVSNAATNKRRRFFSKLCTARKKLFRKLISPITNGLFDYLFYLSGPFNIYSQKHARGARRYRHNFTNNDDGQRVRSKKIFIIKFTFFVFS